MDELIKILHEGNYSLVVRGSHGEITTYGKRGVRDLIWLLDNAPATLRGASVADKVIGKAAAALVVNGGVRSLYAEVMSRHALPLLDAAGVEYTYGTLVDRIIIPEGDTRCRLEEIVADAATAPEAETLLRAHFAQMRRRSP